MKDWTSNLIVALVVAVVVVWLVAVAVTAGVVIYALLP